VIEPIKRRTVGAVIPTFMAADRLERCLRPVLEAGLDGVLIVDSSSTDGSADVARALGADAVVIPKAEVGHGRTREAARRLVGTDVVVMLTQDAFPLSAGDVRRLAAPVLEGRAAVAYGRQVPRPSSGTRERFARAFSYPQDSEIRSAEDLDRLGIRTFFCSNAFAAWDNPALDAVGGFPNAITHEDAIACARLIHGGHRVSYVAEAVAEHSHDFTVIDEFRRYFAAGRARHAYAKELAAPTGHAREGWRYARGLLAASDGPSELMGSAVQLVARAAGYRAGGWADRLRRHSPGRRSAMGAQDDQSAPDERAV
jgi:rhamnosyltransferase